jgi:3-deoxy-manno-octulosonate cytidylyltransferase (CMP-KDO synthetase)
MNAIAIIPARIGSTRFPEKILYPLAGRPLIQWVVERVRAARRLDAVLVATDDPRIAAAARAVGGEPVLTRPEHPSGTDRIAEALGDRPVRAVINVQGDEPFIDPDLIDALVDDLLGPETWDMVTAAVPLHDESDIRNPAIVKVVTASNGQALYFSRAVIPHYRDLPLAEAATCGLYHRHLGIYGYTPAYLRRLVATPPSPLELAEKLEQLRALQLGCRMKVRVTRPMGPGIDTPEDVPRAEAWMRAALTHPATASGSSAC